MKIESLFYLSRFTRHLVIICLLVLVAPLDRNLLSQQTAQQTTKGFKASEGLEVTLWAAEPDVVNPTNIDIDSRGRVWVLEGVNYRLTLGGHGRKDYRPNG